MKLVKRFVAVLATVVVLGQNVINTTVLAKDKEEIVCKSVSIESAKMADEDIPDVLIASGELKNEIQEKFVKRLHNEENSMNTLMFEKENGERTMYLFKKPVKYKDENGNVVDKDIRFKEINERYQSELADKYICDNGNNDVKVYMPKELTEGIKVTTDDKVIEMSLEDDSMVENVKVEEDKVVYDEVFGEKTELIYMPLIDGIKEEIVLEKYTGQTEFKFLLKLDGYKLVELDDNCLYLENVNNGEIEGVIDSVYMIDNAGVTDFNNYYTYTELNKGEYEITAHVNEEFLIDENTQYPVIIDPTISINKSGNSTGIYDATLNSTSTTEGGSGSLYVGNRSNTENGISRVAMKFPGLVFDTDEGGVSWVLSASISVRDLLCESSSMEIECLPMVGISESWTEDSASWSSLGMNNNPFTSTGRVTKTVSYSNGIAQEEEHWYKFDLTQIVQMWRKGVSGVSKNRGVVLKSTVENTLVYKTFGSYNRASYNPVFEMEYVPYGGGYNYTQLKNLISEDTNDSNNNLYQPNCIGLALLDRRYIYASTMGVSYNEQGNISVFKDKLIAYVNAGNCPNVSKAEFLGYGKSSNYTLNKNQYLIVVRVFSSGVDYHAIVQMSNGRWAHKHRYNDLTNLGYIDPDITNQDCWYNSNYGYYDSLPAYIKITVSQ